MAKLSKLPTTKLESRLLFHQRQAEKIQGILANRLVNGYVEPTRSSGDGPKERHVYALLCEGGHYYIGQTTNVDARFKQHLKGKGSWFTAEHKPLEIIESECVGVCTTAECMISENHLAAKYIFEYGIDQVRGGDFIQRNKKWYINKLNQYAPVTSTHGL